MLRRVRAYLAPQPYTGDSLRGWTGTSVFSSLLGWDVHRYLPLPLADYTSKMQPLLVHTFQPSQTSVLFPVRTEHYSQISQTKEITYIFIYKTPQGHMSIKWTGGYSHFSLKHTQGQRLQTRKDAKKPVFRWLMPQIWILTRSWTYSTLSFFQYSSNFTEMSSSGTNSIPVCEKHI